ncbi:MAG: 2-polyprenylphenol hydroxylase, partial [Actinobacteria bacterium]|nr:2-polyprenylphenol hydroxylase [Actinomycetota bacterium]
MTTVAGGDIRQYLSTRDALDATRAQLEELERSESVGSFNTQLAVLRQHLAENPRQFRQLFISSGIGAVAAEFQKDELGAEFTRTLWESLLRDDDSSQVAMRFLWDVPLRLKRKFIRAIATHLTDRYPMFAGLYEGWPAGNNIPPYIRDPEVRAQDFELVNQGYLG